MNGERAGKCSNIVYFDVQKVLPLSSSPVHKFLSNFSAALDILTTFSLLSNFQCIKQLQNCLSIVIVIPATSETSRDCRIQLVSSLILLTLLLISAKQLTKER